MVSLVCQHCGAEFERPYKSRKQKFCSLGCSTARRNTKHGLSDHPLYSVWCRMRQRCNNPLDPDFHIYGGRGIKVCTQWDSFSVFKADMGERPKGKTLDRIKTDGNYEPSNCRWATFKEQRENQRNSLWFDGLPIKQACIKHGINYHTVKYRINSMGWSVERALTTPPRPRRQRQQPS